jgi:peptidoglycan/xylan/chitin deacetylase (PgdA/CDA1 family)
MEQPATVATLVFFWDYDTQWGADRSRSAGGSKQWGHLEFENTERLLELHDRYEIPACFAVVGAAALPGPRPYHDPAQIRRIHAAGHEIASHTFQHEWIPGLGLKRLEETLRLSKDALEQCTGAPVLSFVPPYNQPFDHVRRGSVSLSERRETGPERIDLRSLCEMLGETGYRFSRVSYRSWALRVAEKLRRRRIEFPVLPERIAGITCLRMNTPGGFDAASTAVLARCLARGGVIVVYGHPHSLHSGNSQDEKHLVPFLEQAQRLRGRGVLRTVLPRDLLEAL